MIEKIFFGLSLGIKEMGCKEKFFNTTGGLSYGNIDTSGGYFYPIYVQSESKITSEIYYAFVMSFINGDSSDYLALMQITNTGEVENFTVCVISQSTFEAAQNSFARGCKCAAYYTLTDDNIGEIADLPIQGFATKCHATFGNLTSQLTDESVELPIPSLSIWLDGKCGEVIIGGTATEEIGSPLYVYSAKKIKCC